jgi:hypothetical protein
LDDQGQAADVKCKPALYFDVVSGFSRTEPA